MITDFLKWIWEKFERFILPFTIISVYERGVILTFGKNPKLIPPGFIWKVPFIQEIFSETITPNTLQAKCVHVTTVDGKTISVSPAIEFIIVDAIKWLIDTNDAATNLHDILRAETADHITDKTWDEVKKKTTRTEIKREVNKSALKMGAEITRLMFTDISQSRVIITQI